MFKKKKRQVPIDINTYVLIWESEDSRDVLYEAGPMRWGSNLCEVLKVAYLCDNLGISASLAFLRVSVWIRHPRKNGGTEHTVYPQKTENMDLDAPWEKHNIPPGSQNFAADEFMYVFSMRPDPAAFTSPVICLAYFKGLHFKERGA